VDHTAETATSGDADRVVFIDLSLSDMTFGTLDYSQYSYGGDGTALRMFWNKNGDAGELRIADMGEHIEAFEFADGQVVTADEFIF
jgi:hypothetical protein